MFRLVHVTDTHFRSFAGASPRDFAGKRAIGALNLLVNRGRKHRMELLEALREDLRSRCFDHIALTGDIGNISLPGEWEVARRWIESCGAATAALTVIPGNHDTYVGDVVRSGRFEEIFAPYQTADLRVGDDRYPFARLRGEVALLCVNSCVPTGDLGAWGRVGEAQIQRLEALLAHQEVARRRRVVLIHHPPVVHRPGEDRNLRDRAALLALLARTGAELVLHGHDHRDEHAVVDGPGRAKIPVVGAGSASYAGSPDRRSRYNLYEIDGGSITSSTFVHDQATGRFREHDHRRLA